MLYNFPELCDTEDFLWDVEEMKIHLCREHCIKKSEVPCNQDLFDLCHLEMENHGWHKPVNPQEAIDLYISLSSVIRNLLL